MPQTIQKEVKRRKKNIILITATLLLCAVIYLVISFLGISVPCVFNEITTLKCPGCGCTRAVKSMVFLDFKRALSYNLLFPLELIYIGFVYCLASYNYIKNNIFSYRSPFIGIDITILTIFILWGIIRNILHI